MARTTLRRRTPSVESLESRMVLTAGGPTPEATLMLDILSQVRMNPDAGAAWVEQHADSLVQTNLDYYGISLDQVKAEIASAEPRQPLAYNDKLTRAAQGHSDDMARNNFQSHQSSDGTTFGERLDRAGYTDRTHSAGNAFAYTESVDHSVEGFVNNAMEAFLVDWGVADKGHRRNIQDPNDTSDHENSDEAGIGFSPVNGPIGNRAVVVQNFGTRREARGQLVGVVYEDTDGNGRLSYKEGRDNATIQVRDVARGDTQSVQPWDSGMYQVPLDPGQYEVTLVVDGKVRDQRSVAMGESNTKLDFNLSALKPLDHAASFARSQDTRQNSLDLLKQQQEAAARQQQEEAARRQQEEAARQQQQEAAARQQQEEAARRQQEEAARQVRQQQRETVRIQQVAQPVRMQQVVLESSAEDQMLVDAIASGLLDDLASLNIKASATWKAI